MIVHHIVGQEKTAENSFKSVVGKKKKILGHYRAPNYIQLFGKMLQAYKSIGCISTQRIKFLDNSMNLDFFTAITGERLQQDTVGMEKWKRHNWNQCSQVVIGQ